MRISTHNVCLIVLALVVLGIGCGGDEIDDNTILPSARSDTNASDTGHDAVDTSDDARMDDERCDGLQPGARCELPHASGVCVDARCQFLSCEAGFRDCDDNTDNGCEADITTADQCGACGVSCTSPESCQQSRAGWVCSVSPVCPDERYDLDGDIENGCEWATEWGDDGLFEPAAMQPDVAAELSSGAFAVAGRTIDARLVSSTGAANTTTPAEAIATDFDDTTSAHAIETLGAADDPPLVAVAWTDAVTLSAASGSASDDGVFRFACEQIPRRFRDVAAGEDTAIFAATSREVLEIERGAACAADTPSADRQLCDAPSALFSMSDYVDAYAPEVDATACDVCLPDTDICPEFRPIGLEYLDASARLVVFTQRGFLMLEPTGSGFVAGARLETAQPAQQEPEQGATRYAAGAAVEDDGVVRVYLLTTEGTLRRFVVDAGVRPAGPDIQLLIGARDPARIVPGADDTLLIYDARDAWLVRPLELSARVELLSGPDVFLGEERIIFGAGDSEAADEFSVMYFGFGRYYLRHVRR